MALRRESPLGRDSRRLTMYYCDICNKPIKKKMRMKGYTLCSKHMHQLHKYGKFLDNNPRTQKDFNDYIVKDGIAIFNVYNQKNEKVSEFMIDACDIQKIKYKKWRIDSNNRIITGNCTANNPRCELSRFLLDVTDSEMVVDHKNGNTRDNRRCNLRIRHQNDNLKNKHFMSNNASGYIGVMWDKKRKRWAPEIVCDNKRYHLGRYDIKENAVYARYIAEQIIFKEYRNTERDEELLLLFQSIPKETKENIKRYVTEKLSQ